MSSLTSEKMSANERIASYKLNKISLLAGDINEFCVSLNYDFTTDNDSYVNPAVGANGKGAWPDNYMEIRVKKVGTDVHEIVSIGTGGGGQGLSPVGDNTFNPEKAISMVKKDRLDFPANPSDIITKQLPTGTNESITTRCIWTKPS